MSANAERGVGSDDAIPRILPELTITNEFFWTGGNDGHLRFLQYTRTRGAE